MVLKSDLLGLFFAWKWPDGFICPECGSKSYCALKSCKVYQCNHCHHQTSLTSGTIFASTKLPLTRWFLAIHLVTQSKTGLSALELKRQINVSYNTAWSMKQKIMQVMKERDDSQPLSGVIQLDDVYWGGERHGGSRGRGSKNKHPPEFSGRFNRYLYPQYADVPVAVIASLWQRLQPGHKNRYPPV